MAIPRIDVQGGVAAGTAITVRRDSEVTVSWAPSMGYIYFSAIGKHENRKINRVGKSVLTEASIRFVVDISTGVGRADDLGDGGSECLIQPTMKSDDQRAIDEKRWIKGNFFAVSQTT